MYRIALTIVIAGSLSCTHTRNAVVEPEPARTPLTSGTAVAAPTPEPSTTELSTTITSTTETTVPMTSSTTTHRRMHGDRPPDEDENPALTRRATHTTTRSPQTPPTSDLPASGVVPHSSPPPPLLEEGGVLNFPPRVTMRQGVAKPIVIQIAAADVIDKLAPSIGDLRLTQQRIPVSAAMSARLDYDDGWFTVVPKSPEIQRVDTNGEKRFLPAEWTWIVTPLRHGDSQLTLRIFAMRDSQTPQPLLVREQSVDVQINPPYLIWNAVKTTWPVLIVVIGWFPIKEWWQRRRQRPVVGEKRKSWWMRRDTDERDH